MKLDERDYRCFIGRIVLELCTTLIGFLVEIALIVLMHSIDNCCVSFVVGLALVNGLLCFVSLTSLEVV